MRSARAKSVSLVLAISSLWFAACSSGPKAGQSGSENIPGGGADAVPCPCGREDALRVTLLDQDHGNVTLRVEEVLHGELPLAAGDVIEGQRYNDTFACYLGCASIEVGEQAIAFYRASRPPLPACPAREMCIAACKAERSELERRELGEAGGPGSCMCRADPPSDFLTITDSPSCGMAPVDPTCSRGCERDTEERCPPRPEQDYKRGTVNLSPWAETIVFARSERGELSLPRAALDELWRDQGDDPVENMQRCSERVGDWSTLLP